MLVLCSSRSTHLQLQPRAEQHVHVRSQMLKIGFLCDFQLVAGVQAAAGLLQAHLGRFRRHVGCPGCCAMCPIPHRHCERLKCSIGYRDTIIMPLDTCCSRYRTSMASWAWLSRDDADLVTLLLCTCTRAGCSYTIIDETFCRVCNVCTCRPLSNLVATLTLKPTPRGQQQHEAPACPGASYSL